MKNARLISSAMIAAGRAAAEILPPGTGFAIIVADKSCPGSTAVMAGLNSKLANFVQEDPSLLPALLGKMQEAAEEEVQRPRGSGMPPAVEELLSSLLGKVLGMRRPLSEMPSLPEDLDDPDPCACPACQLRRALQADTTAGGNALGQAPEG